MKHLIDRIRVYSLYLWEYIKFGEIATLFHAVMYMLTRKSYATGKIIRTRMGRFITRPQSLDFQYINYAYELHIKKFIEKEQFNVFIDAGACLGEYNIWLGAQGKRCIAFEPVRESFEMIQQNIELNNLEDFVTAYNYGLGSKKSIEHFEKNSINPGANKKVNVAAVNTEQFEIRSLDQELPFLHLNKNDRVIMKIDVEGMEVDTIKGAAQFIKHFGNIVLIIEEKFSGSSNIKRTLGEIAQFKFGEIDEFNMYARKIGALNSTNTLVNHHHVSQTLVM